SGASSSGGRTGRLATVDPSSPGRTVYEFTATTAAESRDAVRAAAEASTSWAALPAAKRAAVLNAVGDELADRSADLALMITREEGKTLTAATGEVAKTVEQFRFGAQLAYQVEGKTFPTETAGTFAYTLRSPLGVVVAITPWNFPVSLAARKIAPALAAGNAVVFKPSPVVAGCGHLFVDACRAAGVPDDVLGLVQGDDPEAMRELVGSPEVAGVSFTGSDGVGALLRGTTNPRARLQFELGGHNAAVVCADADLQSAAAKVASGAFELTGQACTATDRVLVEDAVYDEFVGLLCEAVHRMRVGPGVESGTTTGPVATQAQHTRLTELLQSATSAGTVLAQADLPHGLDPDGYWVPPTLFADLPADHLVNTREVFGPLLSVVRVSSVAEATDLVNASAHGLVTAVHTTNLSTAHQFAQRATCGIVKVNDRTTGNGVAPPFGGWKESSSGAFPEGGTSALDFVTDTKTVYLSY
ncbi:MAG TPA: aldehyde dehydrogenase family protein, partial [Actinomycetales bacterium]|nr:aldehyde dehydrogenase family protein [Actinomycetales bacterium]